MDRKHKRRLGIVFALSGVASARLHLYKFLFEIIIQERARPFQLDLSELISNLESSSYVIWNFSFPSFKKQGWSLAQFQFLRIIFLNKKILDYLRSSRQKFSRVYFGFHFFSDVIAGRARLMRYI